MSVCIVTPSYNQGRFLARTLRSVASQRIAGLEHVIVDGGSTDETLEVLASFEPRITWKSEPDKGQADAINKGLHATHGEIVGWLNSDDVYYPGALDSVLTFFANNPEVDVVYGQADHIDEADVAFEAYPTEAWSHRRLKEACFICQPAAFFRRRVLSQHGFIDSSLHYCMDYEFWLRLASRGAKFAYIEKKLAGSRMYAQNKTHSASLAVHREINEMLRARLGAVPDTWLYNFAYVATMHRLGTESPSSPRFARQAAIQALLAALRWNHWIKPTLLQRLFPRWFGGSVPTVCG